MANLEEELVAGGVDMGRTWTSRTLWMPQARQLQSTETTIQMPIKKIQKPYANKRKANLEEDFLAGGTDVSRTGHHEDCGRPNLFWSFTKYRNHNTNR